MSAVLDRLIRRNPLLAHGPRTHGTGVAEPATAAPRPAAKRFARWRPLLAEVDAPRVHLGPQYR